MVSTPGSRSVAQVAEFLEVDEEQVVKCLMYLVDGEPVAVLVSGEREVNETKLAKALGSDVLRLFEEADWLAHPAYVNGYVGPVGLEGARIVADLQLRGAAGMVSGANLKDFHLRHVVEGRDFFPDSWADIASAKDGDACPHCGSPVELVHGIEVGQVFQLRTRYSEPMGAVFADETGAKHPFVMGTYGIGVSRLLAAVIEQHHDERGIIWPASVAPAQLHVVPLKQADPNVREAAELIYQEALAAGLEAVIDDRDESAGVKFADADLLGLPWRVVVGKSFIADGKVELTARAGGDKEFWEPREAVQRVLQLAGRE